MRPAFQLARWLPLLLTLLAGGPLTAQNGGDCNANGQPDDEETRLEHFARQPTVSELPGQPEVADLDGDGDGDLVLTEDFTDSLALLLNDGRGRFTLRRIALGYHPLAVQSGDADADDDIDLFVIAPGSVVHTLRNDGDGDFTAADPFQLRPTDLMRAVELNGDGRADLLSMAIAGGSIQVMLGVGDGTFTAGDLLTGIPFGTYPLTGDADGDGDPDLFVGDPQLQAVLLFRNDGAGDLELVSAMTVSAIPRSMAVGDLTGDGAADVLMGLRNVPPVLIENDGTGILQLPAPVSDQETAGIDLVDLDGDDALDLLLAGASGRPLQVLRNDGTGGLTPIAHYDVGGPTFVGDLDGDRHADLLYSASRFVRGRGNGRFDAPLALRTSVALRDHLPRDIAVADVNGDQRDDVIALTGELSTLRALSAGGFADVIHWPLSQAVDRLAAGDLDGDGDPDAIAGASEGAPLLLLDNVDGVLQERAPISPSLRARQVLLSDVDGDADLDVVTQPYLTVVRNDGDGRFAAPQPASAELFDATLAMADVDEDGDVDILAAPLPDRPGYAVFRNAGDGTFTPREESLNTFGRQIRRVLAADINGDQHVDAVMIDEGVRVWSLLGDGTGRFAPLDSPPIRDLIGLGPAVVHDVDADGDVDVLLAANGVLHVLVNPGNGRFVFGPSFDLPVNAVALQVAELDGGPPSDLAMIGFGTSARVGRVTILPATQAAAANDCDGNRRPDECDLAGHDCDGNGRLDGCDPDADGDTVPDACDRCPGSDDRSDRDADGTVDCEDGCPNDPAKQAPGACGCGTADLDPDADGVAHCVDNCRNVANGDQADRDGDLAGDACDDCPDDPGQIVRGPCQCGEPLVDTDRDRVLDCVDGCPVDARKSAPGVCGCGLPEVATEDGDGDGHPGCLDNCPRVANAEQMDRDGDLIGDSCDPLPDTAACTGDCDGDGTVHPDDLRRGISVLFGAIQLTDCLPFDADGDGAVRANDLVGILERTWRCAPPATPTATPTVPPTPTPIQDVLVGRGSGPPALCRLPNGEVRIAFADGDIRVRRYDALGEPIGTPITVSTAASRGALPRIACSADGSSLVVWEARVSGATNGADVMARFLSPDGTPLTEPFLIHVDDAGDQIRPAVTSDGAGRWAVVWQGGTDIFVQHLSGPPAGQLPRERRVNGELGGDHPNAGMAADGSLVVVYGAGARVVATLLDPAGDSRGAAIPLNEFARIDSRPGLAVAADGTFVALWHGEDFVADVVRGRRFSAAAAPLGEPFTVGPTVAFLVGFEKIAVALLPDGGFAAAWVLDPGTLVGAEGTELGWRRFAANGAPLDAGERVNRALLGFQQSPDLIAGAEGVTIAWHTNAVAGGQSGIFTRRFAATP
jgi:hypothetical protein